MDRNWIRRSFRYFAAMLAIGTAVAASTQSAAQHTIRMADDQATGETPDPDRVSRRSIVDAEPPDTDTLASTGFLGPVSHTEHFGCGDACSVECGDPVCRDLIENTADSSQARFYAAFEATIVKPRFEDNVAFTVMESDGASFESFTDTEFDYDLKFTPRVFLGWQHDDGVGLRATWWQFDHAAATASANPPANGFGSITSPTFGNVEISSAIPTDTYTAATSLNAYAIDIEATKETSFCSWDLGVAGGVRYAYSEQGYLAELRDNANVVRDQINYRQSIEGFGPTISLSAYRPLASDAGFFCKTRASVLFGDGESSLAAVEDADLMTPFYTTRTTGRDDLLSIGEIQLGFRWQAIERRRQPYRPFLSVALEGQVWNGAGNASSEDGSLGFFGFNTGVGVGW